MKTLQFNGHIKSLRDREDNSATMTVETPELRNDEFSALRDLKGLNLTVTLEPLEEKTDEKLVIDREAGEKSPSEELRYWIWRWWKEKYQTTHPDKEQFYRMQMAKITEQIRDKVI